MIRNKNVRKALQIIFGVGVLVFAFLGGAYIYRLRTALIGSTETYKAVIVEFEERVQSLEKKNTQLRDEIFAQGVELTDIVSENYELEGEALDVSLNDIPVDNDLVQNNVRFIVAGHLYGAHSEDTPIVPAQTLIDFVPELNTLSPDLFIALGDLAQYPSEESYQALHQNFLDKVNAPVLSAPGNHDFDNGRVFYENEFGQTFYFLKYTQSQVIILDTEVANCFIIGNQKEMLEKAVDIALHEDDIQNIFVFFLVIRWYYI